jgi:hypothetical protein
MAITWVKPEISETKFSAQMGCTCVCNSASAGTGAGASFH